MSIFPLLLTIALAAEPLPARVDFDTEIVPALTKYGCNAGACHGSAAGRGGFKLSLWGSDPAADYAAIVRELEGRRVNLARPEQSLIVLKPAEHLPHGGGTRFDIDDAPADRLLAWIRAGAPRTAGAPRRLTRLDVTPQTAFVERPGDTVSLRGVAHFDDGTRRDVTGWTVFTAADPAAVEIDAETAEATVRRRGLHTIVARFLDRVEPVRLLVPFSDPAVALADPSSDHFIDRHVLTMLERLRLPASPPADDATFLRRARLTLTGRLPTPEEIDAFITDTAAEKRERLIDRLLSSEDFADYWAFEFAKLLRVRALANDDAVAQTYHSWLRQAIADGMPYDRLVRSLLTAKGDSHAVGPAGFSRMTAGPREQAEHVSETFLGVRLRCANCHDHPLDRWTQDDYHGLAAIFAPIDRGRVVTISARGEVTHPATGESAVPRLPGAEFLPAAPDHRPALADWLTDPRNPYFARAIVNRLWQRMMGRGLVEPADDMSETNPATHPELLDELARDFVEHGYDLRHTLRRIATSDAFARSAVSVPGNEADTLFYSHYRARPLEPEVLVDALADVTGVPEVYGETQPGTRAVQLVSPTVPSESLDVLGRCSRVEGCETTAPVSGGLTAKLHALNGPLINRKISSEEGRLHRLIAAGESNEAILTEFYRRALGRAPNDAERAFWQRQFDNTTPADRAALLEDLLWSLLSCREFGTNH